jgi:hypothetical protein
MTNIFKQGFSRHVDDGDSIEDTHDGFTVTATIHRDHDKGEPWKEFDGHGPVSDWTDRAKAPGERVLCQHRGSKSYYDFAAAQQLALKDGWGCKAGKRHGESRRAYAARAVETDFEYLKGWCDDDWHWVGVDVTVSKAGIELTEEFDHALWGIESLSGEYCTEVAEEYAVEALEAAKHRLLELLAPDIHEPRDVEALLDAEAVQRFREAQQVNPQGSQPPQDKESE